jgi:predicted membrane-bound spermidine synthase
MLLLAVVVAAASGFIALSYEILWYRMFSVASGGTPTAFGLVLGYYLYGLAAGGWLARVLCRRSADRPGPRFLVYAAVVTAAANALGFLVVPGLSRACGWGMCLAALPLVALATVLLGATLPLICHYAIAPDTRAGQRLSLIYFANILGSAAGTLFTGYVLMDRLASSQIAVLLVGLGAVLAAGVLAAARPRPAVLGAGVAAMAVSAAALAAATPRLFDRIYERLLYKQLLRPELRFAHTLENRAGVINITRQGQVFGGGVHDGFARIDLETDPNLLIRPLALTGMGRESRNVLVIGLSMGAWTQLIAHYPSVEAITVVEINPGYLDLMPYYPDVAPLLRNPKVTMIVDDGRRWLARNPDRRFDLIVANISFHWREHASNLLSREFLELVRRHLAPGGVYFYNTTESDDAAKTGLTVFPYGMRVMNFIAVSDEPLDFDPERFARSLRGLTIEGRPALPGGEAPREKRIAELLEGLNGGLGTAPQIERRDDALRRLVRARVVTDDNMAVEWHAISMGAWEP